uniref:Auxin Efflux Carrier family protein n=1 Tax=Arundo donax TaxID=35708 RepID=A0A0A9FTN5_ARUDO
MLTGINHQEMTSASVTVFARLANIRDGVKTVKTTLFISLRALVVSTLL